MLIIKWTKFGNFFFAPSLKSIDQLFATEMPDAIANMAGDSLRAYWVMACLQKSDQKKYTKIKNSNYDVYICIYIHKYIFTKNFNPYECKYVCKGKWMIVCVFTLRKVGKLFSARRKNRHAAQPHSLGGYK